MNHRTSSFLGMLSFLGIGIGLTSCGEEENPSVDPPQTSPTSGGGPAGSDGGSSTGGGQTASGGVGQGGAQSTGGIVDDGPQEIDYGSIDPGRLPAEPWKNTQFQDPGGWTEVDVTEHGLIPGDEVDASTRLAEILASTSGRRRLFFPAGVYSFRSHLEVTAGDIWIQGAGGDKTQFVIDAPGDQNVELRISGGGFEPSIEIVEAAAPGADELVVSDASGMDVGDIVQVYADSAPLAQGGRAWSSELYSQLLRVVEKDGNHLRFDMKFLLDYPLEYSPRLRKLNVIRNVKVSDLKIRRVNEPTVEGTSNLVFSSVFNAAASDIESEYSGRNHIHFTSAKDCVLERNYVHDTWKHETGGYGYGLSLAVTTGCRISNNKARRLRHHVIVQVGANHNVISYNSIEAPWHYNDMALHATFAYMNLFEGNVFSEGFSDKSKDGTMVEPSTGPGNTWFRNYSNVKVGNEQGDTSGQVLIGNFTRLLSLVGEGHYVGANLVASTVEPGELPEAAMLPPSLYLTQAPDFFPPETPFPLFGPDVPGWGLDNAPPARNAPSIQAERVENPGFETGTFTSWDNPGPVFSITTEDAHTGTHSLELSGEGSWGNVQQRVIVEANRDYTLAYWAKSETTGGRVKVLTPASAEVKDCGSTIVDAQWRQYFCNFTSGSNTEIDVYVGDGGGHHYFDDFEMY